ncbi:glutamate-5-semialdehyde dehydrogenase [Desulfovibrio sp. 86]|uniref:Gamma-glutamyl phosphate reductase n=1 Tax=uncultured Desulfovibrio sp. TaxID=167968 RepID=A0A212L7T6_9BACT|nr:glutamate-5-semialdehyde dehydrogenase [Desulfovibrio sp. 86]SCM73588.1 Gamma-glutamyl phosphate reductase [uncultured Desulfovibrio sp.]VZH34296.1 Gamma-glutamyl phosphate reductase [Desulfovibrio sp. 86]
MTPSEKMARLGAQAKNAARAMTRATPESKNRALLGLAEILRQREADILAANARDVEAARSAGQDSARLDRLTLTPAIMEEMRAACAHVANLPDPVGATESQWQRPNGLLVGKMRIPLGVIAMIYEARPNVTIDAAILCIKAGNAVILRGGSEALHSNTALAQALQDAMVQAGLPAEAAQLVTVPGHEAVNALCKLDQYIDVIIPRGGEGLVRAVTEAATMPVLKHFKGVCHAYIEPDADLEKALDIVFNGKVQRPGVCNALECLLVHKDVAARFLPMVAEKLGAAGVEFRADATALPLMDKAPAGSVVPQKPEDLGQEFHNLTLAVRVVADMDEALDHIARYGSNHTEIICTNDHAKAMRFLREADASMVAVNASSRFNDGGQLGLGAEIGISTSKLHAYGAMGVKELTTTKFVVLGQGQVRQ